MKGLLVAIGLLLAPVLAGAEELDGTFQLSFGQPMCRFAPCPPARWTIRREGMFRHASRLEVDPETTASIQAAIARNSGLNPSVIEGRIRIEEGVARILVRRFTPRRGPR